MSRGRHLFRQGDLTKAMKAARVAGFEVLRVEIDQFGKIGIVLATSQNVESQETKDEKQCDATRMEYD